MLKQDYYNMDETARADMKTASDADMPSFRSSLHSTGHKRRDTDSK